MSLALLSVAAPHAHADDSSVDTCFRESARRYAVDEHVLRAIAQVESNFDATAIHRNSDGSHDVGLMQINSKHLERLKTFGVDEAVLIGRPCINIAVGAWVLAGFVQQHGATWRAVGSYNAGNSPGREASRKRYALLVHRALGREATLSADARAPETRRMQVLP